MLRNAVRGGGVSFPRKRRYKGSTLLALRVGGGGVKFPGKKRYVTLMAPYGCH